MAHKTNKFIPKRSLIMVSVCMIAWCGLIARLGILQFINYDKYQNDAIGNIQRETQVSAQRGTIYAMDGITPLATNITVWRVFISPRDIETESQARDIATELARILDADYEDIMMRAAKKNRADETIKKNVDEDQANLVLNFINEKKYNRQIHLEPSAKRYYTYGAFAAQVLGCVGTDGGLFGLELKYDADLKGIPGRYITARTGLGKRMPFKHDSYVEAKNGVNLITTLDLMMQNKLREQLERTYIDSQALNRVTGIIMDVKTGGIRAMATYPDFDLNSPYQLDQYSQALLDEYEYPKNTDEYDKYYWNLVYTMWRNKSVSELYEPGSTFKIITTAMALEENAVTFADMFTCTGSLAIEGYNKPIRCHRFGGHGTITFARGLQQSCNPTLMQVAALVGKDKFYEYFKAFGYTEKTGVDLPGESSGIYHSYNGFNQVELAVYSFGQTFKTTPLQQLTAICAVANGGYLVTPHLVSAYTDDNGTVIKTFDNEPKRQVVSAAVCKKITEALEQGVATDGGAKNAYVAGYKIAAKTGTSEVRDILNEAGESFLRIGSCVGYAPADDPQIAIIIIVDQPQGENIFGSVVAAPYIANLFNEILPSMGIERNYTEEELAKLNFVVANYQGWPLEDAKDTVTRRGLAFEVVGNLNPNGGDVVRLQIPEAGAVMSKEKGKIIFYIDDKPTPDMVEVPKLIGQSAEYADYVLGRRKLNMFIDGSANYNVGSSRAVIVSQSPAAGEMVPRWTVVKITMRYLDGTE